MKDELLEAHSNGRLMLFVGAGVSADLGLPDWNALIERIACRRRSKSEPPCRLNIEPGVEADVSRVGCG